MQKIDNALSEILQVQDGNIGSKEGSLTNARDLHAFLGSKQIFHNWLENRLADYIENEDFLIKELKSTGGRPRKECFLTVGTAKELAMLERNEKGRQARRYFIEVEEAYKEGFQVKLPQTYSEALRQLAEVAENNERLELVIKEVMPKAKFAETFLLESGGEITFKQWADGLNCGFGDKTVFKILRFKGYLCQNNAPKQTQLNNGNFSVRYSGFEIPDGPKRDSSRTLVTKKGMQFFTKEKLMLWRQEIPKDYREPKRLCEKKYKKILEPHL